MRFPDQPTVRHEYGLVHECELYGCDHGDSPCFVPLSDDVDVTMRSRTINNHPARMIVRTVTYSDWKDVP